MKPSRAKPRPYEPKNQESDSRDIGLIVDRDAIPGNLREEVFPPHIKSQVNQLQYEMDQSLETSRRNYEKVVKAYDAAKIITQVDALLKLFISIVSNRQLS